MRTAYKVQGVSLEFILEGRGLCSFYRLDSQGLSRYGLRCAVKKRSDWVAKVLEKGSSCPDSGPLHEGFEFGVGCAAFACIEYSRVNQQRSLGKFRERKRGLHGVFGLRVPDSILRLIALQLALMTVPLGHKG